MEPLSLCLSHFALLSRPSDCREIGQVKRPKHQKWETQSASRSKKDVKEKGKGGEKWRRMEGRAGMRRAKGQWSIADETGGASPKAEGGGEGEDSQ